MEQYNCKKAIAVFGNVAKKVLESAAHAAVFAYVSKRVTSFMEKQEKKEDNKVRIEDANKTEATKTGG